MNLQIHILPAAQQKLLVKLQQIEWPAPFYLAGGTGLALQIGHRQSIDFDFFTETEFDGRLLITRLGALGKLVRLQESKGTLHCSLDGIKLSFFHYPYYLRQYVSAAGVRIASVLDIGLMKLEAISGRGDKKDFIDLYFILGHYSLATLLEQHADKYGVEWTSRYHLLRSLVYFADAEDQPMPLMLQEVSWIKIKQTITETVLRINQGE